MSSKQSATTLQVKETSTNTTLVDHNRLTDGAARLNKALVCCPLQALPSITVNSGAVTKLPRRGALTQWPWFVSWFKAHLFGNMQRVHFARTVQDLPQSPCGFKCANSRLNYRKPTDTHLTRGLQGPQSACWCWMNIAALLPGWDSGGQQPVKTTTATTAQASIYHSQLQPPP